MFCLNDTMRYYLCPGRTDMRKGISSLCGVVHENAQQISDAHDEAVEKIAKTKEDRKQEKKNRVMMEDLPVLEQVILRPDNLDETLYRKIGQEVTRIVEHKPGQLYIKEIIPR